MNEDQLLAQMQAGQIGGRTSPLNQNAGLANRQPQDVMSQDIGYGLTPAILQQAGIPVEAIGRMNDKDLQGIAANLAAQQRQQVQQGKGLAAGYR